MLILGIDTSCSCAKASLAEDRIVLAEAYNNDQKTHSVKLMPMIQELFRSSGRSLREVGLIGVVNGPGSFTGLRIGAATAKAFAYAESVPLVGINTLDFLAASADDPDKIVCAAIDARNTNVYSAIYFQGKMLAECQVRASSELASELLRLTERYGADVQMTGDGADAYWDIYTSILGGRCGKAENTQGNAGVLCSLALEIYTNAEDKSVFRHENLQVNYYRPSQAERLRAEKEAGSHV